MQVDVMVNRCTAFEGHIEMLDVQMKDGWPQYTDPVLLTHCANSVCKFYGGTEARRRVVMTKSTTKDECDEMPVSLIAGDFH